MIFGSKIFILFLLIVACNPFDPFGSTAREAKKATVRSAPAPGVLSKGAEVTFTSSVDASSFSLYIDGYECQMEHLNGGCALSPDTPCSVASPESKNPCDYCRRPRKKEGNPSMVCLLLKNSSIDYKVTVGVPESSSTGKRKSLGTFTIQ